jgi:hypothetical protein
MTEPIFFKNKEGNLVPLTETPFEREEILQVLLAEHPELIFSASSRRQLII